MEIDESQLKELRAVQLDTLKFLFKDIDGKTIEQEFERCNYDFPKTKEAIKEKSEQEENKDEGEGDQVDMGLYTISDYEDSDDEDEGDEEDDEPDDDKEQKESDEEKKEKLPDIGKIKLEDEKRLDGKKKHHHHREHDETKESRRARRRKQQQKAKRTIKDFRNKGGRIGFSEKNSELYTLLKEYSLVLRPEIKFCKYKLKKALKYKKDKAVRFWSKKIKELQEIFMLYQCQAVEIKLEANSTDIEKNTVDLHSLTLSEALLTVKEFIIKKRSELRESQDENCGFIEAKIITGKGKHSKNKAIIKPQVMKFLEDNQILYQIGGTGGCLIVFITI